jgi:hypothetical protein
MKWNNVKYPIGSVGMHKGQPEQKCVAPVNTTSRPTTVSIKVAASSSRVLRAKEVRKEYFIG